MKLNENRNGCFWVTCRFYDEAGREVEIFAEDGWRAEWPKPAKPAPLAASIGVGVEMPALRCRQRAGDSDSHTINFVCKKRTVRGMVKKLCCLKFLMLVPSSFQSPRRFLSPSSFCLCPARPIAGTCVRYGVGQRTWRRCDADSPCVRRWDFRSSLCVCMSVSLAHIWWTKLPQLLQASKI